jgi:hypothetical protein
MNRRFLQNFNERRGHTLTFKRDSVHDYQYRNEVNLKWLDLGFD